MNKAFTLIEVAIVLIVIGLVVGGILQGAELLKQARIGASVSQLDGYNTALNAFRLKYNNQIPGDTSNAVAWGMNRDKDGNTNTCYAGSNRNGNNNKILEDGWNGSYVMLAGEIPNYWVHLSNLGFIKEELFRPADITTSCWGDNTLTPYTHFPLSEGVGERIMMLSSGSKLHYVLGSLGRHSTRGTIIGGNSTDRRISNNDLLTTEEAYSLDVKMDDGKPLTGGVTVIIGYIRNSTEERNSGDFLLDNVDSAANCISGGEYNLTRDGQLCTLAVVESL